ncbi:MAG TPA: hypothetical protein VG389_10750 [Myxococcota bacterium]|jgi:hypothetical protein|nr:hypothetical protein [Myxococcota bacterium]
MFRRVACFVASATAAAAVAGAAGCGGPRLGGIGGACTSSTDCAAGLACIDPIELPGGYCTAACDPATPCPGGAACIDELCFQSCTPGSGAAQCRDGYVCTHQDVCALPCTADAECPASFFCADDGVCTDDADRPPPDPGEVGAPCAAAGECDPGLTCLPPALGGRCSRTCDAEPQCANGTTCSALAVPNPATGALGLEAWCVFSSGTVPFGVSCGGLADGAGCAEGVCWNGVCTELCSSPADPAPTGECGGGSLACRTVDFAIGAARGPLDVCDVPFPLPPLLDVVDFGVVASGEVLTFSVPDDAVSFTVTLDGVDNAYYAALLVEAPDGHYYIDDIPGYFDGDDDPIRVDAALRYFAVTVPSTDRPGAALVGPGDYSFTVAGANATARVYIKRQAAPTRVDLNFYIVAGTTLGTTPLDADTARGDVEFTNLLNELGSWYAEAGLEVGVVNWFDLADPSFATVDSTAELRALFASSRTDVPPASMNVFFVNALPGGEGTGGISGGIPGALLGHGNASSGVAITLIGSGEIMGMALFHELGHFVGLWHAKESFGGEDPLLDTPSCPEANPPTTEPCASTTGRNFMYWSLVLPLWEPTEPAPNCAVCDSQKALLRVSPATW